MKFDKNPVNLPSLDIQLTGVEAQALANKLLKLDSLRNRVAHVGEVFTPLLNQLGAYLEANYRA